MSSHDEKKQAQENRSSPVGNNGQSNWLRRIFLSLALFLALLLALLALAATGPVLRLAVPMINMTVSEAIDANFMLGEIRGSLWTHLMLERLTFENKTTGLRVDGRHLQLSWAPWALLRGVLQIDRLAAGSLSVVLPRQEAEDTITEDDSGAFFLPPTIRLKKLEIQKLKLVDPINKREFLYKLEAAGAKLKNSSAHLSLALLPLDTSIDRLRVELSFGGETQELQADIDGYFDRAGIIMTLAGLQPGEATDVRILLQGSGPAEGWHGELTLTAADLADLSGKLGLQFLDETFQFTFSGQSDTKDKLAEHWPGTLRGPIDIALAGQFGVQTNRLTLTQLNLSKPGMVTISASGDIDLAAGRLVTDLQAKIQEKASTLFKDAVQWEDLRLKAHAEGELARPDVTISLTGRSVATPILNNGELSLTLSMAQQGEGYATRIKGTALDNQWTEPDLDRILGGRLDMTVSAEIMQDFSGCLIDELLLTTPGIKISGSAELQNRGKVSKAWLQAKIADLSLLKNLTGLDMSGAGQVEVSNGDWQTAAGGRADFAITADQLGFGQTDLDRLVGPQPMIAGQLELSPQLELAISLAQVKTAMVDGTGVISFSKQFSKINIGGDYTVQPGAISPESGVSLTQAAHLSVALVGPVQAPAGEIRLAVPELTTAGELFEDPQLISSLSWSNKGILTIDNRLDFTLRENPYRLQGQVVLLPDRLLLDNFVLDGKMLEITGQLELPGYTTPMRGEFNLSRLNERLLTDWGVPVSVGDIRAKGGFQPVGNRQRLVLELAAKDLRMPGGDKDKPQSIDSLAGRGHIDNLFNEPIFDLHLTGSKAVSGKMTIDTVQANFQGALGRMRTALEAKGQFEKRIPMTLEGSADMALAENMKLTVDDLKLTIGSQQLALLQPLPVSRATTGEVDFVALFALGDAGRFDFDGRLLPNENLQVTMNLKNVDLRPWGDLFDQEGLGGSLSIFASLDEQIGKPPKAQLKASVDGLKMVRAGQLPPLKMKLDAFLRDGRAKANLLLGQPEHQIIKADAEIPITLSILKGQGEVKPDAPLSGHADIDAEISQIWSFLPFSDHLPGGRILLTADLSGSFNDPVLDGGVKLRDGRYEHLRYGTLLRNIYIDGQFDRHGLYLSEITADDGGKGMLTGKAEVEFAAEALFSYTAELNLRDMAVTRMDEMKAWADIDLDVLGDDKAANVTSTVTINHGEVDLEAVLPPLVPQLDVEKPDQTKDEGKEKRAGGEAFVAHLKVTVDIPGQLFVRGKGLDSEWGGNLEINGSADNPKVVGELHARRGQFDVFGKTFVIHDSKITFLGEQPTDPRLDIVGVYNGDGLTVTASLSGPASKMKLTISSQPFLPQEEILSRVLFGTSQSNLSAVQALQLAEVVSKISGGGGGLDVLGSLRKFLNVDVLRVEGGKKGPQVEVGKYLTEGVYVGTKRGLTSGSTGVEVEIELTPHIKMTTESTNIDTKTGIQFKWDY